MHLNDAEFQSAQNSKSDIFEKQRRHCALSCLLDCLHNCCFLTCINSKHKKWHINKSKTSHPPDLQISFGWSEESSKNVIVDKINSQKTLNESPHSLGSRKKHSQVCMK